MRIAVVLATSKMAGNRVAARGFDAPVSRPALYDLTVNVGGRPIIKRPLLLKLLQKPVQDDALLPHPLLLGRWHSFGSRHSFGSPRHLRRAGRDPNGDEIMGLSNLSDLKPMHLSKGRHANHWRASRQ